MKKIVAILLILGMVLCMNACENSEKSSNNTQTEASEGSTPDQEEITIFSRFEKALNDRDISYETTEMAAELIGAKQGIKYNIGEGKVELYLFDEQSEAYITAFSSQKVTLEGFGDFSAHVASGAAMLIDGLDESTYITIFDEITK